MNLRTQLEPTIPRLVWWSLAAVTIGSIAGLAIYAARSPSWDRMVARTGAPEQIKVLAALQRYTESRGNPRAGLGRPELFPAWAEPNLGAPPERRAAESKAAADGYDQNADAYSESPYPRRMWVFGSGGAYGLLPSSALSPWRKTDELRRGKVTPYDVFNPWRSTVFFVDYVYRLVSKRSDFGELPPEDRTVLALKRGLASPRLVADHREQQPRSRTTRRKATEAAEALGLGVEVLDTKVPLDWPRYRGARELVP